MADQAQIQAAQQEAERLIAKAKACRAIRLELRDLAIQSLPDSLAELADHLTELALVACTELCDISACRALTGLVSLKFQRDPEDWFEATVTKVSDLSSLAHLTRLQVLDLSACPALKDVNALQGLTRLQTLDLSGCRALTDVSVLQGLTGLQTLDLSGCDALTDVSVLQGLTGLQTLDLSRCRALTDVSVLQGLTGLQTLHLSGCDALTDVSVLQGLTGLQTLALSGCDALTDVSVLQGLTGLQTLALSGCDALTDVSVLQGLTGLQTLDLSGCDALTDVSVLQGLTGLQTLHLSGCDALTDVSVLQGLTGLQTLHLSGCDALTDVSVLQGLTGLQTLDLSGCDALTDVSVLQGLTGLQTLDLSRCRALTDVSVLQGLTGLQTLHLSGCDALTDVSVLQGLTGLQTLALSGCRALTDVSVLQGLTGLQTLDLSRCRALTDVSVLQGLTGLQTLHLSGCDALTDVSVLQGLTGLQTLDLSRCRALTDVSGLQGLTGLQTLDLSRCRALTDVSGLQGLTGLQTLYLSECGALTDVSVLQGLTGLQRLDLRGCGALTDVSGLQGLTGLQTLDLSRCRALTDVSVLQGLTGLQTLALSGCDALTDVSVLQGLTGLQTLALSGCDALTDVSVLQGLTGLQTLALSGCGALTDVSVLQGLTGLLTLDLFDGPTVPVERFIAVNGSSALPSLNELHANRLLGVPAELTSARYRDNCLPRLRAWGLDLARGRAAQTELKLFLLGNGRVGKTQICRRLRGLGFDDSVPSTHGIQLGEHRLELGGMGGAVTLRFWDFGGQDIYLGTHALFLEERAIYLIVWSPEFENNDETEHHGVLMRNRPLAYWLAYVYSLAGPKARVLLVQTRCDRLSDRRPAPLPAGDPGFEHLVQTHCSSNDIANPNGMKRLLLDLEEAAQAQIEAYGRVPLPQSWADLGGTLAEWRDGGGRKTLPVDEFNALCRERHGVLAPGVVLDYLHRGGQVFWNQMVFGGEIVLQLDWALDGIYAVLHREQALPLIRAQRGLFTPALLALGVWRERTEEERMLFLSMMEQCQIVFKVAEGHHVLPMALPDADDPELRRRAQRCWRAGEADAAARLGYGFLHEGVLRAILCGIGEAAGTDAVYWRYGLCVYDEESGSTLRISSELPAPDARPGGGGSVVVEAKGGAAAQLVQKMVSTIQGLRIGSAPTLSWLTPTPEGSPRHDGALDAEPRAGSLAGFANLRPGLQPQSADLAWPVYVSYAWGGESEDLVDRIEQRLCLQAGIEFVRDKRKLRPGAWISSFMADIGRAELVLVVLSDKYLRSPYCMRELMYLHQSSQGERAELMRRVVPLVVGNLAIDRAVQRVAYVKHWKNEDQELTAAYAGVDLLSLGESDRAEWLAIKDFGHHVSDMVAWCADVLMPRGAAGVEAVCELLAERVQRRR